MPLASFLCVDCSSAMRARFPKPPPGGFFTPASAGFLTPATEWAPHPGSHMSEPISGSAAGVAGWKLIGGLAGAGAIGAGLASLVVMCMMTPRSRKEWAVGLTSTVVGSACGGSAVIMKYGLLVWAREYIGLVALIGLAFACGLPAWALVRWTFNFIEKRRDKDLAEVAGDVRDAVTGGNHG